MSSGTPQFRDVVQVVQNITSSEREKQILITERKFIANLKALVNDAEAVEIPQVLELLAYVGNNGIFELIEIQQTYTRTFYLDVTFVTEAGLIDRSLQTLINTYEEAKLSRNTPASKSLLHRFEICHRKAVRLLAEEAQRKTLLEFTLARIRNREYEGGLTVLSTMIGYVKEFPQNMLSNSLLSWVPTVSGAVQGFAQIENAAPSTVVTARN